MKHLATRLQKIGRELVCRVLEWQVIRLKKRHAFTIVTVSGSIGKTSTKLALAAMLEASGKKVRFQEGNYNDRVTVPLVLFNQKLPALLNIFAWIVVFARNESTLRKGVQFSHAVLELGTDGPGQIEKFAYLRPDLAIITAITPEHMEYFHDLAAVAQEELAICSHAKAVLINSDDTPTKWLPDNAMTYGIDSKAGYRWKQLQADGVTQTAELIHESRKLSDLSFSLMGPQGAKIALAAAAAGHTLGLSAQDLKQGAKSLRPAAGRLRQLLGIHDSLLLDDTYNASPEAVNAAISVLSDFASDRPKLLIIGGMNELGEQSQQSHISVAETMNAANLDHIIVVGELAIDQLLPYIEHKHVTAFYAAPNAGAFAAEWLADHPRSVVLAKGSQNGVFAEEVLKPLLADPTDSAHLVRQSDDWLAKKRRQFARLEALDADDSL